MGYNQRLICSKGLRLKMKPPHKSTSNPIKVWNVDFGSGITVKTPEVR
jgi:hypothetical protein